MSRFYQRFSSGPFFEPLIYSSDAIISAGVRVEASRITRDRRCCAEKLINPRRLTPSNQSYQSLMMNLSSVRNTGLWWISHQTTIWRHQVIYYSQAFDNTSKASQSQSPQLKPVTTNHERIRSQVINNMRSKRWIKQPINSNASYSKE